MEPVDPIGFTAPKRAQLLEPGELLLWARGQFNSLVGSGHAPEAVVAGLREYMGRLGVPPRLLVRCRISDTETDLISVEWAGLEARPDSSRPGGWYLHIPATAQTPKARAGEAPAQPPKGSA